MNALGTLESLLLARASHPISDFFLSTLPAPLLSHSLTLSHLALLIIISPLLLSSSMYLTWLLISLSFLFLHAIYAVYQMAIITVDVLLLSLLKTLSTLIRYIVRFFTAALTIVFHLPKGYNAVQVWRRKLRTCTSYNDYSSMLQSPLPSAPRPASTEASLELLASHVAALKTRSIPQLRTNLSSYTKRNHVGIDNFYTDTPPHLERTGTYPDGDALYQIDSYQDSLVAGIERLSKSKSEPRDNLKALRHMRINYGTTGLMLSGGGSITMYHMGLIRVLIAENEYDNVEVISGTSGGSIMAAFCATCTPEELLRDVCVENVSTDYKHSGEMAPNDIRWFPTMSNMARNWLRHGVLVPNESFMSCTEFYFGDMTFAEAYAKTNKHVCMTVTASRAVNGSGTQRLLLNHISTPHVTVASAVAASCALPGIMPPCKLTQKIDGKVSFFEVDGVEWIDGSFSADVPFKRISQLFNVTNFIVSQVNFHVVPFLNKAHHPLSDSMYWKAWEIIGMDLRSRVLSLSKLGLFPKLFGNDVSKVFKQSYTSQVTIIPKMRLSDVLGFQAFLNPTVGDMRHYLRSGEEATYPYVRCIQHLTRVERCVKDGIESLERELGEGDVGGLEDEGKGERGEVEKLKERLRDVEAENKELKAQLRKERVRNK